MTDVDTVKSYSLVQDPDSGVTKMIEDISATSFGPISDDDIRLLMEHKKIPKTMGKKAIKRHKDILEIHVELARKKAQGAADKEILDFMITTAPTSMVTSTESIKFFEYLLKNRKELAEFLTKLNKTPIRQTRDWIDSKLDTKSQKNTPLIQTYSDSRIRLSQAEDRLVHSLTVLLSKKSEISDQNSPLFHMGNSEKGITAIDGFDTTINSSCKTTFETARLIIKPHELYKTYTGTDTYSGEESKFILKCLIELSKRCFNFSLRCACNSPAKFKVFRTQLPLWQFVTLNQDLSEIESHELSRNHLLEGKNCYFLFRFGPVFTNNIKERYVEVPEDMHLRITAAAKTHRIPECAHVMRDFLLREKQSSRPNLIRDEETLVDLFNLKKPWEEGRKQKIREQIKKWFEVYKTLGLIKNFSYSHGKKGQRQYEIEINLGFK